MVDASDRERFRGCKSCPPRLSGCADSNDVAPVVDDELLRARRVELIELLLTPNLIDEMTDIRGKPNGECLAQGTASTVTGLLCGMVESNAAEDPHYHLADDRLG